MLAGTTGEVGDPLLGLIQFLGGVVAVLVREEPDRISLGEFHQPCQVASGSTKRPVACLLHGGVRYGQSGHRVCQLTGAAGAGTWAADAGARSSGAGAAGVSVPPWSRRNGG